MELPASDVFSRLATALAGVKFTNEAAMAAARSIVLPNGSDGEAVQWPGLWSNALFVRDFYNDFFSSVLCKAQSLKGKAGAIILGTPGIAKSAFGLYVLFRAVREGKTVIYVSRKANRAVSKAARRTASRVRSRTSMNCPM
jgi:hypothetical protein